MRTATPTSPDLEGLLIELKTLSVGQLRSRFCKHVGYASKSRNRPFLIRKILWGIQAQRFGDISAESRIRAAAIADERDVITRLPKVGGLSHPSSAKESYRFSPTKDRRLPLPGAVLIRDYKGREIRVIVGAEDFQFEGKRYSSLSAIAKQVTGTSYNGFLFFKLK